MMKLKRQEIILLLAIWGVVGVLLVVAVITLRPVRGGPGADELGASSTPTLVPLYTPPPGEISAKNTYPLALEKAKSWREDAQLVACRGTWEQTAINLVGQPVQWDYRFYSAQAKTLYFVTVTPDGQVAGTQHMRSLARAPSPIVVESWQVDSPAALTNWLNAGGGAFLGSRPGVEVAAQLSVRQAGADPQWTVVGYDPAKEDEYFAATVNARTNVTDVVK
jgi:hypothetical protein